MSHPRQRPASETLHINSRQTMSTSAAAFFESSRRGRGRPAGLILDVGAGRHPRRGGGQAARPRALPQDRRDGRHRPASSRTGEQVGYSEMTSRFERRLARVEKLRRPVPEPPRSADVRHGNIGGLPLLRPPRGRTSPSGLFGCSQGPGRRGGDAAPCSTSSLPLMASKLKPSRRRTRVRGCSGYSTACPSDGAMPTWPGGPLPRVICGLGPDPGDPELLPAPTPTGRGNWRVAPTSFGVCNPVACRTQATRQWQARSGSARLGSQKGRLGGRDRFGKPEA